MARDTKKPVAVVSFLSGKGGSGKTTASLAIGKLLADVGLKVLLVDFDLATSGASYFFAPKLSDRERKGLAETLEDNTSYGMDDHNTRTQFFRGLVLTIGQNFDFIPSRSNLGKPFSGGPEISSKDFLVTRVLKPLLAELGASYDCILIDNQAGYTNTSAAGATVATKAIVVSESDRISSDAVDNLLGLIGSDLPRFRRYLINKVEIREAGDYRKKVQAFREMNRLPPLPFDFDVRNAFGEREIPVDLEDPKPFLMALFTAVKDILPEKKEVLEEYEMKKVTQLFDKYQRKLDAVLEKRESIQEKIIEYETIEKRKEASQKVYVSRVWTTVAMFVTGFAMLSAVAAFVKLEQRVVYILIAGFITAVGAGITVILRKHSLELLETAELEAERTKNKLKFQREMAELESEVDRYNNLLATRSRDLLVDFDKLSKQET